MTTLGKFKTKNDKISAAAGIYTTAENMGVNPQTALNEFCAEYDCYITSSDMREIIERLRKAERAEMLVLEILESKNRTGLTLQELIIAHRVTPIVARRWAVDHMSENGIIHASFFGDSVLCRVEEIAEKLFNA